MYAWIPMVFFSVYSIVRLRCAFSITSIEFEFYLLHKINGLYQCQRSRIAIFFVTSLLKRAHLFFSLYAFVTVCYHANQQRNENTRYAMKNTYYFSHIFFSFVFFIVFVSPPTFCFCSDHILS